MVHQDTSRQRKSPAQDGAKSNINGATEPDTKPQIKVIRGDGAAVCLNGREAQTLWHLIQNGPAGDTSLGFSRAGWARRTSAYVFNLRRMGFDIASDREPTPDGASVARYRLLEPLKVVATIGLPGGSLGLSDLGAD